MSKIFVRERRKIEKREKNPRLRIVGVNGNDIKLYSKHIRKMDAGSSRFFPKISHGIQPDEPGPF